MARPRVFVSSTFYDLRQIRTDLERFIRDVGFDPVLNERGTIPYGSDQKIEEYAYKEIENADIVVSIVGGRFGSQSQHGPYSISQNELKRAVALGKQVFVFIESSVFTEYRTWANNKGVEGINFSFVDDPRVYEFIEEVEALPNNNPMAAFESAQDITRYLREQWAGLFQRFLAQQLLTKQATLLEDLQATAQTLDRLVTFLTQERDSRDEAIQSILLLSHPAFQQLRKLLNVRYRLVFTTRAELDTWLKARSYEPVPTDAWDEEGVIEWTHDMSGGDGYDLLKVDGRIFDEAGKLRIYTSDEWDPRWMSHERRTANQFVPADDDIPF